MVPSIMQIKVAPVKTTYYWPIYPSINLPLIYVE